MTFGTGLFGDGTFGAPAAWVPGDAWPSPTPGGAQSPDWGGYVRVWVRAALAAGTPFHLGAHANADLDGGHVLGGAPAVGVRVEEFPRLWVDLTCDVMDLEIAGGALSSAGVLSKPDTATLSCTLHDPDGIYDPLSTSTPYAYMGRSRLTPGVPVECFAEVVDGDTGEWTRHWLFTGTADSWGEGWTPDSFERTAELVASDVTKQWVQYNYPEQPEAGAGDTTQQRVERLADFYQWPGTIEPGVESTVTLQATTFAQPGWELLGRTLDDELGYVYFTPEGHLRWLERAAWARITSPVLELGCPGESIPGTPGIPGTPSVPPDSYLTLPVNYARAETPDPATTYAGDLDVRAWVRLAIAPGTVFGQMVGQYPPTGTVNRGFVFQHRSNGRVELVFTTDGTTAITKTATTLTPGFAANVNAHLRAVLDVDDGAGNYVVRFYVSYEDVPEPTAWTQIGTPIVTAGAAPTIYNSTAPLRIGDGAGTITGMTGARVFSASVRRGDGTIIANPDFTDTEPGATTVTDAYGNVFTMTAGATIDGVPTIPGTPDIPAVPAVPAPRPTVRDVLVDASPSVLDDELINQVAAARTGGEAQTARSETSITQYGEHGYNRTDLGVATDPQAGAWANFLLAASAYPQVKLADVTLRPSLDARSWEIYGPAFDVRYVSDLVRIAWAPPDRPEDVIDGRLRVLGHTHQIDRETWEIKWTLTAATALELAGTAFTLGPHAQDRLDAGYVLA